MTGMFSTLHTRQATHTALRALCVGLVAFYVLASARGLVPGLCGSFRVMATSETETPQPRRAFGIEAATVCCYSKALDVRGPRSAGEAPDDGAPTPLPESGECAFCHLAKAVIETPDTLVAGLPADFFPSEPESADAIAHGDCFDPTTPGRAPPA